MRLSRSPVFAACERFVSSPVNSALMHFITGRTGSGPFYNLIRSNPAQCKGPPRSPCSHLDQSYQHKGPVYPCNPAVVSTPQHRSRSSVLIPCLIPESQALASVLILLNSNLISKISNHLQGSLINAVELHCVSLSGKRRDRNDFLPLTGFGLPEVGSHGGWVPAATPGADVTAGADVTTGADVTAGADVPAGAGVVVAFGRLPAGAAVVGGTVGLVITELGAAVSGGVGPVTGEEGEVAEPQTARGPGDGGHAPGQQMERVP
jgi:hypothetical protein